MKPKVYIETSVISYLTARKGRDIRLAGDRQHTRVWWEFHRARFELFSSDLVLKEASAGDAVAARDRLDILNLITILNTTREAIALAKKLIDAGAVPQIAEEDALHIAIAATHQLHYLLTWNCRHIANAVLRSKIDAVCRAEGCTPLVICMPPQLMGIQAP